MEQYIERAEQLKQVLQRNKPSLHRPAQEVEHIKSSNARVKAALAKANTAEQQETSKNYKRALELYKEAVEMLMSAAEGIGALCMYLHRAGVLMRLHTCM